MIVRHAGHPNRRDPTVTSKRLRSSTCALFVLAFAPWLAGGSPPSTAGEAPAATASAAATDTVKACWDAFQPAEWGKLSDCLGSALEAQEAGLSKALAAAEKQAGETMDKASAKKTLDASQAQWAKYRDAECDRQLAFVAGRNHPDIGELTCRIRETTERIADLRFDEE
jgi:uncharacterized protein YecT (DUF1311 family)